MSVEKLPVFMVPIDLYEKVCLSCIPECKDLFIEICFHVYNISNPVSDFSIKKLCENVGLHKSMFNDVIAELLNDNILEFTDDNKIKIKSNF